MTVPEPTSNRPDYAQGLTLYATIVDEYRFQVQLNWDRVKYLLGYNTAVFTAGVGLLKLGGALGRALVIGIFAIGVVGCGLTAIAVRTQHGYYVTIRDQMTQLATSLNLDREAVATTPGARGVRRTWGQSVARVQTLIYAVLGTICAADVLGVTYVIAKL